METYKSTKQQLIATETPKQTRTYKPVTHQELMDLTLNGIEKAGFVLGTENYSSAQNGQVANARYTIKNVADSEMQLEVGWQNSYNKSLSLKFAMGTRILICQNGCVHGDFGAFKKKHMGEVQTFTPQAISDYIKIAGDTFRIMQQERDQMKQIELTNRTKAELIGRMILEESFIQSTQINIISREIKSPTHDYGAANSMWEFYNYTTFAMKETHPSIWMQNHMSAHKFFVNESGILKAPEATIVIPEITERFTQLELGI